MTLLELRNKRNKLLQDAQKLLLADSATAESRTQANAMITDADLVEADITSIEKIEAENRSVSAVPRGNPSAERSEDATAEARAAMLSFMRGGFQNMSAEHRSLMVEKRDGLTTANAGQLIPQAFYPVLTDAMKSWGDILNIVGTRKTDNGAPMKVALDNDTGNSVVVIGEATAVTETDPTFTGVTLSTDELTTGVVKVSLAELQDSAFDLNSWLKNVFGKRYFRGLANLVTNGSSTTNIAAITGATTGATSAAPTAIAYDDITALYGALDPAYVESATWTMNSTVRAYLMGIVNTLGNPIFIANPSSGAFDTLLGRPVKLNQSLAGIAAGHVCIQFGDYSQGYLLRTVGDLSIYRLSERYIDSGQIGFIGYGRAGGVIMDAGTHPILNLVQHA